MRALNLLFVCALCMIPGWVSLGVFGFSPLAALPMFWGGMLYKHYIDNH
jgi:hypothetical protein